jgi:hypothetical protein
MAAVLWLAAAGGADLSIVACLIAEVTIPVCPGGGGPGGLATAGVVMVENCRLAEDLMCLLLILAMELMLVDLLMMSMEVRNPKKCKIAMGNP